MPTPTPPLPFCGVLNRAVGDSTDPGDFGDSRPEPGDLGVREVPAVVDWSAELAGDRRRSSAFWPVSPVTWVKLLVLDRTSSTVVLPPPPADWAEDGEAILLEGKVAK